MTKDITFLEVFLVSRDKVLLINPGSTSTKVAIFCGEENLHTKSLSHSAEELKDFSSIVSQFDFRKSVILDWLKEIGVSTGEIEAIVARGGLLRPMPSGIYEVSDFMVEDLKIGYQGEHASNLGGIVARSIGDPEGIKSYIVDPVAVDEFIDLARISGHPLIKRQGLGHALNVRAMGHKVAKSMNKNFEDLNMIICHLGGGISVIPVTGGKMIDNTNANYEGPFSPERAGGLPIGDVIKLSFSGKYDQRELINKVKGRGGLVAYLNTNDIREVEKMIAGGDKNAELVLQAMAYQIGKQVGAVSACLKGHVDVIIITGGVAHSKFVTNYIEDMVSFIAPVRIEPGEDELAALNNGYLRMKAGEDRLKVYEDEVKHD